MILKAFIGNTAFLVAVEILAVVYLFDSTCNIYLNNKNNLLQLWQEKLGIKPQRTVLQRLLNHVTRIHLKRDYTAAQQAFQDFLIYFQSLLFVAAFSITIYCSLILAIRLFQQAKDATKCATCTAPQKFKGETDIKKWIKAFELYIETMGVVEEKKRILSLKS